MNMKNLKKLTDEKLQYYSKEELFNTFEKHSTYINSLNQES
jgi:hypothetical protein